MIYQIEGSDVASLEAVGGAIYLAGVVKSPHQQVSIRWDVDGASGSTECEAWRGQHEIDALVKAGYKISSVAVI